MSWINGLVKPFACDSELSNAQYDNARNYDEIFTKKA